jgi:hypothetical protein
MGIQNSSRLSSSASLNDPQSMKLAASTKSLNVPISQQPDPVSHRLVWCMYVPESPESNAGSNESTPDRSLLPEDASKVFLVARKNRVDIFHLGLIEKHHDISGQRAVDANDLSLGHLVIDEVNSNVLTACFSPDGSAIALSCIDGDVYFYKISFPAHLAEITNASIQDVNNDVSDSEQAESEAKPT